MRIAVVCTGNHFRSPIVAELLRRRTAGLDVDVESCGVLDVPAAAALPEAVRLAEGLGLDLSEHTTCPVTASGLRQVDLVIGFERAHVAAACLDGGAAREVAFTLPALVGLLRHFAVPEGDPRETIARAAALRERERTPAPEVEDPLGKRRRAQRRIARELEHLTAELVTLLFAR